jgi:heterodisulfide reductase subunit B
MDYPQREGASGRTGEEIPVLYFTQLMAVALGLPEEVWGMEEHHVAPRTLFEEAAE